MAQMKRIIGILLAFGLFTSCYKDVPPADIVGCWQAVHEDWTIVTNGQKTTASYDLKTDNPDDFAQIQLYHSSIYILSSTNLKTSDNTMTLNYSDRFTPLEEGTTKHTKVTYSVKMKRGKIKSGRIYWGVVSSTADSMVMEYDSGSLDIDGVDVRRKCRFVFEKTWDKVIRK